jgi:hypothetical protein
MKKYLYYLLIANILIAFTACNSSSRAVRERRSLMMPKKSEMPRNAGKYKERDRKYNN